MNHNNKLRLVMFEECNRSCESCCNNDFNFKTYPQVTSYVGYDLVMLTGGEPMLNVDLLLATIDKIREETWADIIIYTAKSKRALTLVAMLYMVEGITLTLHEQYDVRSFRALQDTIKAMNIKGKSLRLNVFSNVNIDGIDTTGWLVKSGIEWIENCPLPTNETLMRL